MFFDDFKEKLSASRKKKFTLTKRDAAVGVTVGVLCLAGSSIVSYEPGTILFQQQHPNTKTAKIGEYSKSAGPRQVVEPKDYDPNAGIQKPATLPQAQEFPQFNMPIFNKDKLPTGLPSFTTNPTPTKPTQDPFAGLVDNSAVYAKHASITNGIKEILNQGFKLETISPAPKDRSVGRFNSSFVFLGNGGSLEKFELLSIVRTPSMKGIKNAKDALNALVEEDNEVNILEDKGNYLIYDFAGSRGYQIGKIAVDDQGIYILGYINLTTSDMPSVLKQDWSEKLATLN